MKRLPLTLLFLFFAVAGYATDTTTTNIGLVKPSVGSTGWGTKINADWDIVDSSVAVKSLNNSFSGVNTFTNISTMTVSSGTINTGTVTTLLSKNVTVSSNTILPGATFYQTGNVLLGDLGFNVSISSNVVMPGATFYQNSYVVYGTSIVFSPSTLGVFGTRTNDNALGGYVGEEQEVTLSAALFPATGVTVNASSITLAAGDWDVYAQAKFNRNGGTPTDVIYSLSTTSAVSDVAHRWEYSGTTALATINLMPVFVLRRLSVSTPTILYLTTVCTYTVATPQSSEILISTRRAR